MSSRWACSTPTLFPLQSLFGERSMVLQNIRVDSLMLSFDSLLVILEGQLLEVPLPRNHFSANKINTGTAGAVATSGDKLRISQSEALRLNVLPAEQNALWQSTARSDLFHYPYFWGELRS